MNKTGELINELSGLLGAMFENTKDAKELLNGDLGFGFHNAVTDTQHIVTDAVLTVELDNKEKVEIDLRYILASWNYCGCPVCNGKTIWLQTILLDLIVRRRDAEVWQKLLERIGAIQG